MEAKPKKRPGAIGNIEEARKPKDIIGEEKKNAGNNDGESTPKDDKPIFTKKGIVIPEVKNTEDKIKFLKNFKNSKNVADDQNLHKNPALEVNVKQRKGLTHNIDQSKIEFTVPVHGKGDDQEDVKAENLNSKPESTEEDSGLVRKLETIHEEIKFGDIKILERLGQGAGGVVDKAIHGPTKTLLALKKIPIGTDSAVQKQVSQELKIMKEINCEYIVTLFGEYLNEGYVTLALEYLNFGTLTTVIKLAKIIPENILKIFTKQIILGINYLHSVKHIIHRDIKPSNILICYEGIAKISDFGVSGECMNSIDARTTFVGTLHYMSPERLKGQKYLADSDIWSIGLMIYECAVGYFPIPPGADHKETTFWQLMDFYNHNPIPDINIKGYSKDLSNFITLCLQKDPPKRCKSVELLKHPFIKDVDEIKDREVASLWLKKLTESINKK